MPILGLSIISWLAVAIMVAAIVIAWQRKFLAIGTLVAANIAVMVLYLFDSTTLMGASGPVRVPTVQWELTLDARNLYDLRPIGFLQLFTSMFLHADLFHIFGNMLTLVLFALPFEERIGHRAFLILYILSGLAAALVHIGYVEATTGAGEATRLLGASGAVFGIIGAFAGAFPNLVLPLPIPIIFMLVFVRMRVIMAAAIFAGYQVFYQMFMSPFSNVAYVAHLGGLAAGLILAATWVRAKRGEVNQQETVFVDLGALRPFARDSGSQQALHNMETSFTEPDVFHAWLERFFQSATCSVCNSPIAPQKKGSVVCTRGHRFDVRRRGPPTAAA